MTNKIKKGLILTPLTCKNAEQHCIELTAALKEVRKPILGKHVTRFGTVLPVQAFPQKKKTKQKLTRNQHKFIFICVGFLKKKG